jgi:hypothetical protein
MSGRRQFSLRALFLIVTLCCVLLSRGGVEVLAFLAVSIVLILGPMRFALDVFDRWVLRLKGGDRLD